MLTVAEWDAAIDQRLGEDAANLSVSDWDQNGDNIISKEEFNKAAAASGLQFFRDR